jgi:hypothetical protein
MLLRRPRRITVDYRIVSILLVVCCLGLLAWAIRLRKANTTLQAEVDELSQQLAQAVERLAQYEAEPKSRVFSKTVNLLAAAGVPGLILLGAMAVSGFSGAAAITVALASLGGPAGMLGGIGVLISVGVAIAKFGVTDLSMAVVRKLLETSSKTDVLRQIDALPAAVPQKYRLKAKSLLETE